MKSQNNIIYTEGVDYAFIDPDDPRDLSIMEILSGPYAGVKYQYGKVRPTPFEDKLILSYTFDIVEGSYLLQTDQAFNKFAGDVLYSILIND